MSDRPRVICMGDARAPCLTLLLGGARSGKSRHAETLIEQLAPPWRYIATAEPFDDEMRARIAHHIDRRGAGWRTLEAPIDLPGALAGQPEGEPVLVDCLTVWLTNVMLSGADVAAATRRLIAVLQAPRGPWFIVANEVGLGIVPDNALARRFRDEAGRLNQAVAAIAGRVLFLAAGLPLQLKG